MTATELVAAMKAQTEAEQIARFTAALVKAGAL